MLHNLGPGEAGSAAPFAKNARKEGDFIGNNGIMSHFALTINVSCDIILVSFVNKKTKGINNVKTAVRPKISKISSVHIFKLVYRSLLFVLAIVFYVLKQLKIVQRDLVENWAVFLVVGVVLFVEMVFRFFPSKLESMGCQKQFKRNFKSTGTDAKPVNQSGKTTALVAAVWIGGNAVIGVLHILGSLKVIPNFVDEGVLLLISLFYAVSDMICILFFCPFQTFFMKNKCCTSCRIYNWDYPMMFTPFVFLWNVTAENIVFFIFAKSLLFFSLLLLIRWEVTFRVHPEWFSEKTNASLACANCQEKLCAHKKQLKVLFDYRKTHKLD